MMMWVMRCTRETISHGHDTPVTAIAHSAPSDWPDELVTGQSNDGNDGGWLLWVGLPAFMPVLELRRSSSMLVVCD